MNYSFYKSDLDPDSDEEMTQALSRTIEEVFDMQEGVLSILQIFSENQKANYLHGEEDWKKHT